METIKKTGLALFMNDGTKVTDIEVSRYDEGTFEIGNQSYLVLTDDEADKYCADRIKDSVWAFNKNFIIGQCSALDFDDASEKILDAIQEQCESGNDAMLKLIDDIDEFIDDAKSADGRGHFMNSYDGEENEMFFKYGSENQELYIYREN